MLELIKSERFQIEYQSYYSRIEKITDDNVKKQATSLLKTLVSEVQKVDSQHQEMFAGNQIPTRLTDVKGSIISVRKNLHTLLTDWEQRLPKN